MVLWGLNQNNNVGYGPDRGRWPATEAHVLDSLSVRRVLDGRDARFDEPSPCRKSALHWNKLVLAKGSQPFREAMPERFNRTMVWAFINALSVAHEARFPAERFRYKPCDPERTSGSHATTCP